MQQQEPPPLNEKEEHYIQGYRRRKKKYELYLRLHRYIYNTLQMISVVGATSVPFLLNISGVPKIIATIISIAVAIAATALTFYRIRERMYFFHNLAEIMSKELHLYDLSRGPYKGLSPKQAFDQFISRAESQRLVQLRRFYDLTDPKQN